MRSLLICVLWCVATQLVVSLPVEPSGTAVQEQQSAEQQETLLTLDLGDPRHELSARDKRTIGELRRLYPGLSQSEVNPEEENQLSGAESQQNEVRVQFTGPEQEYQSYSDQESAASGGNVNPADATDGENEEDPRNKRYLGFGFGGNVGATGHADASAGAGGGSGNFLFDIIRLLTGSSNTESSDDGKSAEVSAGVEVHKDDGYQAGIPGPITRLFVIANRGLANLMQDLILRLAQTSERIVNFKAKLITSII